MKWSEYRVPQEAEAGADALGQVAKSYTKFRCPDLGGESSSPI